MSTEGDEQGKKITANTLVLKPRVLREGVHENLDRFFLQKKGIELLTGLASF